MQRLWPKNLLLQRDRLIATGALVILAALAWVWLVIMVGMMVPSAMPAILLFAALQRHKNPGARGILPGTAWFTAGYLLAWTAFSLAAPFAQWGLATIALLSPAMVGTSPILGGA